MLGDQARAMGPEPSSRRLERPVEKEMGLDFWGIGASRGSEGKSKARSGSPWATESEGFGYREREEIRRRYTREEGAQDKDVPPTPVIFSLLETRRCAVCNNFDI